VPASITAQRIGRLIAAGAVVGLSLARSAAAQPSGAGATGLPAPGELRQRIAKQVRALVGEETRIGDLRYEVLSSRFVAVDVELGPIKRPRLRVDRLVVELALLGAATGRPVQRIEAEGVRASIPAAWLDPPLVQRAHPPLEVRSIRLRDGEIAIRAERGEAALLSGTSLTLTGLRLPAAEDKQAVRVMGKASAAVERVALGSLVLEDLTLNAKLDGARVVISGLAAKCLGGSFRLGGTVLLDRQRIGRVSLTGKADLAPWGEGGPRLTGTLTLKGKRPNALSLAGQFQASSAPAVQRGSLTPAPPIRLRLRVGRRMLRGTAADWQLR